MSWWYRVAERNPRIRRNHWDFKRFDANREFVLPRNVWKARCSSFVGIFCAVGTEAAGLLQAIERAPLSFHVLKGLSRTCVERDCGGALYFCAAADTKGLCIKEKAMKEDEMLCRNMFLLMLCAAVLGAGFYCGKTIRCWAPDKDFPGFSLRYKGEEEEKVLVYELGWAD